MSELPEHIRVLRALAQRTPGTTMLELAIIGAMEELAEEIQRLSTTVAQLRGQQ